MGKNSKAIVELAKGLEARKREAETVRGSGKKREPVNPLAGSVNEHAAKQGDYVRHNNRTINRGGTTIARWRTAQMITDGQMAAILHCERLWSLTEVPARVVANLDRAVFGSPGDGNVREIEARHDLHRIRGGFPPAYWSVFENVVRFDEPAGLAGSKLAADDKQRRAKAHVVVCFVADMIVMRERLSY
ncbi:MAG TPA: hypothetical protein VF695_00620 [Sphingomonas sp.]|jgi:hypothetical protein